MEWLERIRTHKVEEVVEGLSPLSIVYCLSKESDYAHLNSYA
jgi:hypothetical protein